ncbi:hypothetical protein NL676_010484 [Syzygium grande]|nr:hypothetical protein NL676_010484 [Syzygium grande]
MGGRIQCTSRPADSIFVPTGARLDNHVVRSGCAAGGGGPPVFRPSPRRIESLSSSLTLATPHDSSRPSFLAPPTHTGLICFGEIVIGPRYKKAMPCYFVDLAPLSNRVVGRIYLGIGALGFRSRNLIPIRARLGPFPIFGTFARENVTGRRLHPPPMSPSSRIWWVISFHLKREKTLRKS